MALLQQRSILTPSLRMPAAKLGPGSGGFHKAQAGGCARLVPPQQAGLCQEGVSRALPH